mgnify:CR=1 FL=1
MPVTGCLHRPLYLHIESLPNQYESWGRRIFLIYCLELLPQGKWRCLFQHTKVDVFGQVHSDGRSGYFIQRSSFFYHHWSWLNIVPYSFNLASNDEYILYHLLPQWIFFALELLSFHDSVGCRCHLRLEVDIVSPVLFFSRISFSLCCCC